MKKKEEWLENGNLTRVDLAFSRDQEHKEYVQHRIMEESERFNEWIEQGSKSIFVAMKNVWRKMSIKPLRCIGKKNVIFLKKKLRRYCVK